MKFSGMPFVLSATCANFLNILYLFQKCLNLENHGLSLRLELKNLNKNLQRVLFGMFSMTIKIFSQCSCYFKLSINQLTHVQVRRI